MTGLLKASSLALMALTLGACTSRTATTPQAMQSASQEATLNDAQITKIVTTTNTGEIELAKLAKEKSKNPAVLKFADHMIMDHEANNTKSMSIASKMQVTPEENVTSSEMQNKASMLKSKLMSLSGPEFDRTYIENQVSMHKEVLDNLTKNLIPMSKDSELKAHLDKTRSKVMTHLDQAMKIQKKL